MVGITEHVFMFNITEEQLLLKVALAEKLFLNPVALEGELVEQEPAAVLKGSSWAALRWTCLQKDK